jgi:hypothetical protein
MMKGFVLITAMVIVAIASNSLSAEAADKGEKFMRFKASVQNVTANSVTLVWTCDTTYIDGFRILIIGGEFIIHHTEYLPLNRTSYTLTGLRPNTQYHFTIEARDKWNDKRFYSSNKLEVTTKVLQRSGLSDWRVKVNWLQIEVGMSFDQVIKIFGTPTKTDMASQNQGIWYYEEYSRKAGYTVSGNIFFANGQVVHANPPVGEF